MIRLITIFLLLVFTNTSLGEVNLYSYDATDEEHRHERSGFSAQYYAYGAIEYLLPPSIEPLNAFRDSKAQTTSFLALVESPLATKGGAKVGGGADLKNLSPGEQKRIQNAANKSGADITVVGSQTTGKRPGSDFDFILEGGTSRSRSKIKNSLPQGPRGTGEGNGRDFLKGPVDKSLPHIKFKPKSKG